jgi:hypothetical protein
MTGYAFILENAVNLHHGSGGLCKGKGWHQYQPGEKTSHLSDVKSLLQIKQLNRTVKQPAIVYQ